MAKAAAKKTVKIKFSEAETRAIQQAALSVWDECGYDCLQATAEETGKSINRVTISRAQVIEIALDAGRAEQKLEQRARLDAKRDEQSSVVTADFLARYKQASYEQLIAIVKPAFSYARYGL